MYLSKLEIVGFKSFAQKTNLRFNPGISAVVGPNGCGKSNIVDAIRWVLGEQKTSVLRSDLMENVIFNGTKNRKPLSMAEVTLTIENSKNILPTEYSEVTITRRLFRSGESEYLMNKAKCRLRDIVDLFMDTGLGPDSYSVIELKMVEAILSGRAEERRALFEEAAGIKKYKLRRKEASRKLENVQSDLNRVNDILEEVRKNVNSLSRQAAKTKRYNTLMSEYKELEIRLLHTQYSEIKKGAVLLHDEIKALSGDKIKFEFELSDIENKLNALKIEHHKLDSEYLTARETESAMSSRIADAKREIAVSNEKLSGLGAANERINKEIDDSKAYLERTEKNLEEVRTNLETIVAEKTSIESEFDMVKTSRDEAHRNVQSSRESSGSANERVFSLQNSINTLSFNIKKNQEKKENLENRLQRQAEETTKVQSQIDEIDEEIENSGPKKDELDENLKEAEQRLETERARQASLQSEMDEIRLVINDKRNLLSNKNAQLEFLNSLIDTNETAKFLLKSNEWNSISEKNLLAEMVGADEKIRLAVAAALAHAEDYFIVDNKESAYQAIEILKKSNKGKAAFICKDSVREFEAPSPIQEDSVEGWMSELVRVDDILRNSLRALFPNTLIVEDRETALRVLKNPNVDAAVSLDGEYFAASGLARGGSINKAEVSRVGKKERIKQLSDEISAIKIEIEDLELKHKSLKEEYSLINIQELSADIRKAENDIKQFNQTIAQLELKKQSLNQSLDLIEETNLRYADEISEIEKEIENIKSEASEAELVLATAKEEYKVKLNDLNAAEKQLSEWDEKLRSSEIKLVQLRTEYNSTQNEFKRLENNISNAERTIRQKNDELSLNERTHEDLTTKLEVLTEELINLERDIEEIKVKRDYLNQEKNSLSEQLTQYSDSMNHNRKIYDKLKESIHEKELKHSEQSAHLNAIAERFLEEYESDIETKELEPIEHFSVEEAKATLHDLKSKLAGLGNVNFAALEEFEKESERLNFYEAQVADLIESEKTLKETIEEINQTAEKNFKDTFEQIHSNFKKLFGTLFGEDGEAELKIDYDNLLETDIEIMAKPPNKRPNTIEQLSGGEKTLTAIALLFAIYLVKPSPFCILDEVDAPLDDANIGKFVNLIKEFSKETQFLIVTHNKKTMAAADTLYGVTQQEFGVSKTVAVKINESDQEF